MKWLEESAARLGNGNVSNTSNVEGTGTRASNKYATNADHTLLHPSTEVVVMLDPDSWLVRDMSDVVRQVRPGRPIAQAAYFYGDAGDKILWPMWLDCCRRRLIKQEMQRRYGPTSVPTSTDSGEHHNSSRNTTTTAAASHSTTTFISSETDLDIDMDLIQSHFQRTCNQSSRYDHLHHGLPHVGVPYYVHRDDLARIAPLWKEYIIQLWEMSQQGLLKPYQGDNDPFAHSLAGGWCIEMVGYVYAVAHLWGDDGDATTSDVGHPPGRILHSIRTDLQVRDVDWENRNMWPLEAKRAGRNEPVKYGNEDDSASSTRSSKLVLHTAHVIHMGRAYFPINYTHGRRWWNTDGKDLTPDGAVQVWVKSNATAFSEIPWPLPQDRQHYRHINRNASSTYATNASTVPDPDFLFDADPLDWVSNVTLTLLHETYERYRRQRQEQQEEWQQPSTREWYHEKSNVDDPKSVLPWHQAYEAQSWIKIP
jgi:hypothetical protein